MPRKSIARLLLLLLTLPWLAGCWNRTEVEENAYVLAIGIDRGESMPYNITAAIARPAAIAGKDGGGDQPPLVITSIQAPSLTGAISMINSYTGRIINLTHLTALFVSEEMAREEGVPLIDELLRYRETRRTIFLVVTRDDASTFLEEMKPAIERNPIRYLEQITYHYQRNAMMPADGQINSFAMKLDVNYAQPLSYYAAIVDAEEQLDTETVSDQAEAGFRAGELPRKGGTNIEMIGAAVFRRQQMVGVLTGDEIRHVLMLQDRFRQALVSFKDPRDPNSFVSVRLSRGRPRQFTPDTSNGSLRGHISLEAELLGVQSGIDYSEPELQRVLEQSMSEQIEAEIRQLIERTQELKTDVAGFGRHVVTQFPTVDAWEAYDWPSRFPNTRIDIGVTVKLRRFGLTLSPVEATH